MKSTILFSISLLTTLFVINNLLAQPCAEDPIKKKGSWKHGADGGLGPDVHPNTVKYKKQINLLLDSVAVSLMKSNPTPIGSLAEWYKTLGTEYDSVTSPDPSVTNYMLQALFYPYQCNKGVIKPFSQTDSWLFVQINGYWPSGYTLQHEMNEYLHEKLFTLPPQRGSLSGYPLFEPIPKGEWDNPTHLFYSVLVHHSGKLPYVPITKREFFDLNQKLIEANEKKELFYADIKNATAYQIKNNGEDYYKKNTERLKKKYQGIRDNLQQLRTVYEKEMDEPTTLVSWEWTSRSLEIANPTQKKLFTTPNRGYQLVRANPDYMDRTKEKWKPQFIWVEWYKPVGMANAVELDKAMRAYDYAKLGKLLTK